MGDSSPVRMAISSETSGPLTPASMSVPSTPRSAPATPRGDIANPGLRRHSEIDSGITENQEESLIWGTTVNLNDVQRKLELFFETFVDEELGTPKYRQLLEQVVAAQDSSINLDCRNLLTHDEELYKQLERYPQELVPVLDVVVNDMVAQSGIQLSSRIQVRPFRLLEILDLRNLDPSNVDQLICVRGMVIRCGELVPDLKAAFFKCDICSHEMQVRIDRGRILEPPKCRRCSTPRAYRMVHNRCVFGNKQLVRLQESPENIPDGFTPKTIDIFAFDDLVDVAKPGDRLEITGIFRAVPKKISRKRTTVNAVYKTYLDAIHVKKSDSHRFGAEDHSVAQDSEAYSEFEESDVLAEVLANRQAELEALATDPNIYQRLVDSISPSIYGMEDVKRGVLCQLFGGTNKDSIEGRGRFRGEINVLMCGDPGVAKSQLLRYVHSLAPRGIYTSGKGSSAVGLTAYVTKDPETGQHVLESGALVLSDRGICCIDEFDKMSDSARSILHEVMEQQTVSIAKAGVIATLNARTAILAAANPVESRYNPKLSVVENLRLPPTLLSRFDLIYLCLDQPSDAQDRRLAKHIVSMYYGENSQTPAARGFIPVEVLSRYISHARTNVHPKLSQEAADELVNGYTEMRKRGQTGGRRKVVTATPRQLESLVRLSEALAKMRYAEYVLRSDVIEALRLMDVSLGQSATDPTTGLIDVDIFVTGITSSTRQLIEQQSHALRALIGHLPSNSIRASDLLQRFNEQLSDKLSQGELLKVVEFLANSGEVRILQQESRNPEIRRLSNHSDAEERF